MHKSGWQTTEFWITACSVIGAIVGTLQDVLSPDQAAIAAGDILFTAMKSESGAIQYFTLTVEVEF